MRKKLYHLVISCGLSLSLLLIFSSALAAHTEQDPFVTDLAAGNPKNGLVDAGDVLVWNDADYLYVKYVLSADWYLAETHLHIATSLEGLPQTSKGNAIPGQFDFSMMHDPLVDRDHTYVIPLGDWDCGDELYIAAHGVVQTITGYVSDICALIASLPETVDFNLINPDNASLPMAYFGVTILDTLIAGFYPGWCIDTGNRIEQGPVYTANVYPTDNCPGDPAPELPFGLVEYPENLDLVNWIINQHFVGLPSACGGTYTYGDVQRAIWALIDDAQSTDGIGAWSQCRVDEILAAAWVNGEGFTPACGQNIALILVPIAPLGMIPAQVIFFEYPMPCIPVYGDETVWAVGDGFPGKDWSMYFKYTVQCETQD